MDSSSNRNMENQISPPPMFIQPSLPKHNEIVWKWFFWIALNLLKPLMCKNSKHIWAFSQIASNYTICCGSFYFAVTLQCFKFKRFLLELDYDYYAGAYPSINSSLGIYILFPHASISDFSVSQKHIFYYYEKNTGFFLLFTIESWVFTNRTIQQHGVHMAKSWTDNNDTNVQGM